MAIREKRHVHRSLFTPGSRKFWRLRQKVSQLMYVGLILNADDEGKLEGEPEDVLALFPRSNWKLPEIKRSIKELADVGLITVFDAGGCKCIEVTEFVSKQGWHGISAEPSKVYGTHAAAGDLRPPNNAADGDRGISLRQLGSMGSSYIHTTTKPTTTPNQTTAADSEDSIAAFARAKRRYRDFVGKSMGGLGARKDSWAKLVNGNGADRVVKAVEMWAREGGRGMRDLRYPLAVFMSQCDEWLDAVDNPGGHEPSAEDIEDTAPGAQPLRATKAQLEEQVKKQQEAQAAEDAERKKKKQEEPQFTGFGP